MGVSDEVGGDLAQQGIRGDDQHHDAEPVGREAKLERSTGQQTDRNHDEQVDQGEVERDPG